MAVRTPDTLRKRLKSLHDTSGLTWREIAARDEFRGVPPGTLCAIAKGAPVPKRHLEKLGLPLPSARVVPISGAIPDGAQATGARWCVICGQSYISNHPRRRRCFDCSPPPKEVADGR